MISLLGARRNIFLSVILVSVLLYSGISASAQEPAVEQTDEAVQVNPLTDKYVNSAAGFEMDIPQGWIGYESKGYAIAYSVSSNSTWKMEDSAGMMIIPVPKSALKQVALPDPDTWAKQMQQSMISCTFADGSYVMINQVEMMKVKLKCLPALEGIEATIQDFYLFSTENDLVLVAFYAFASGYETRVSQFEESLNTIKVYNPVGLKESLIEVYGLEVSKYEVTANGTQVEVKLESNADISNLEFHEEQKLISFRATSGTNETKSLTTLTVIKSCKSLML